MKLLIQVENIGEERQTSKCPDSGRDDTLAPDRKCNGPI